MRSIVKRSSFTLRMRENSDAATPFCCTDAQRAGIKHADDLGGQDRARLLKLGIRITEVAEDVAAAARDFEFFRHCNISLNRLSRSRMRSTSAFGGTRQDR